MNTHATLHGERTMVRPTEASDLELLVGWHADPEINRWWDGPLTHDVVAEKYLGARSPEVETFIIESDGRAIGFIQYWLGDEPRTGGLDMFLVPEARGQGLGPDAARAVVRYLLGTLGWSRVTVDPLAANTRAVRGYEKAGFAIERNVDADPPWILMAVEASTLTT